MAQTLKMRQPFRIRQLLALLLAVVELPLLAPFVAGAALTGALRMIGAAPALARRAGVGLSGRVARRPSSPSVRRAAPAARTR